MRDEEREYPRDGYRYPGMIQSLFFLREELNLKWLAIPLGRNNLY